MLAYDSSLATLAALAALAARALFAFLTVFLLSVLISMSVMGVSDVVCGCTAVAGTRDPFVVQVSHADPADQK